MFLYCRISFSLTHHAALRILYYLVLVKVIEIYIKRKLHCKPDYIINQIANTVTDKTKTKVVHRNVIQDCNKAYNLKVNKPRSLQSIKVVLHDLKPYFILRNICIFR